MLRGEVLNTIAFPIFAPESEGGGMNQIDFDFDAAQPVDDDRQPEPAARHPETEPGAMLNDHGLWVSDEDVPF
jgi:hypothetical protein